LAVWNTKEAESSLRWILMETNKTGNFWLTDISVWLPGLCRKTYSHDYTWLKRKLATQKLKMVL
jgi:hypothetical protein